MRKLIVPLFALACVLSGASLAVLAQSPIGPFANLSVRASAGALSVAPQGNCGTLGPFTNGANVQVRSSAGALHVCGDFGGGGTPGGANTQVQYNDGGAFGGDAGMTFNETSNVLSLTGGYSDGTNYLLEWDGAESAVRARNAADSADVTVFAANFRTPLGIRVDAGRAYVDAQRHWALFEGTNEPATGIALNFGANRGIGWDDANGGAFNAPDTGIARNAAGVVEINTGTIGTIGSIRASYRSSDNSAGVTVTTCTAFKNGICTAGTAPEALSEDQKSLAALRAEVSELRALVQSLRAVATK